ncbi:hypothetical protein yc1106_06651 [Curvularia clavata]|uniref:Alpha/beta hydrolase fold-3 domain-containing protein n=1 Tax=Curvularia clavata TaxID=95742 RepID=A0A9Q8ZA74_CURCL|nr:hypothetical protein yc1106_06651 [Curvularia clavata]
MLEDSLEPRTVISSEMQSKDYYFKQVDDSHIGATVHWKPTEDETVTQKYGICLAFHGGGFVVGSRHMIPNTEVHYLCDRNYVVVSVDYRLCPQIGLREVIQDGVDAFSWCQTDLPSIIRDDAGIELDVDRIVVLGQSAGSLLALHLGSLPDPPKAILDFYGVKYISDDFWYTPLPALNNLPSFEKAFLNRIHDEPTLTTTATSLERVAPATSAASQRPQRGMPAPDLSLPRNAWLFTALKNGEHMAAVLKDSLPHEVEPTLAFSPQFPPTVFVHGEADTMIPCTISEKAHKALEYHGVQTQLLIFQNQNHGFDAGISKNEIEWEKVQQALDFLVCNGNRTGSQC